MNQAVQVSVDESGGILIPAPLPGNLHLSPGMTLAVEPGEQGGVRLRIQAETTTLVEKDGLLVARVMALRDLADVTLQERNRRASDLLQRVGL